MASRSIVLAVILMLSWMPAWSGPQLQELATGTTSLEPYVGKGQWVVVKIWASDCHVCNQTAQQYVDFHEFHRDKDAVMLGISIDGEDRAAALAYIERHGVTYPNLITDILGGARLLHSLTGQDLVGTPTFLLFDPAGELRAQQAGAVSVEAIERFMEANGAK